MHCVVLSVIPKYIVWMEQADVWGGYMLECTVNCDGGRGELALGSAFSEDHLVLDFGIAHSVLQIFNLISISIVHSIPHQGYN